MMMSGADMPSLDAAVTSTLIIMGRKGPGTENFSSHIIQLKNLALSQSLVTLGTPQDKAKNKQWWD
jgi:hypothetical protein